MATITKSDKDARVRLGSTPWGNLSALRYHFSTNAAGAVIGSDTAAAVASGDKIKVGLLPAGFRIVDSLIIIATAMSASVTAKVGFEYADGVDVTAVPQDDDYFGAALVMSSAARLRNATANPSAVLPKEAWLTVTTGGAANAKASAVEVVVFGIAEGVE
ncbi:hypothetical protein [Parazoarcus communis]|uniref:Uncharacterized protein n=1 Tax=Parazoarcus communis SWub3 = DSM 12120 TaxID=1121029 RepID=A0A323USE9_9RHOO|nr:hypothetical protein [Parazoarcus communis]NMG71831.1 hypothetical protein [Parazoarcus communis SWub3 = DSM 12120]PZA14943.1 hypothetical protein DNK49_19050 [Azoarcus communis] [Parazoarcus communis SWub3 = DSM 12120]